MFVNTNGLCSKKKKNDRRFPVWGFGVFPLQLRLCVNKTHVNTTQHNITYGRDGLPKALFESNVVSGRAVAGNSKFPFTSGPSVCGPN